MNVFSRAFLHLKMNTDKYMKETFCIVYIYIDIYLIKDEIKTLVFFIFKIIKNIYKSLTFVDL